MKVIVNTKIDSAKDMFIMLYMATFWHPISNGQSVHGTGLSLWIIIWCPGTVILARGLLYLVKLIYTRVHLLRRYPWETCLYLI